MNFLNFPGRNVLRAGLVATLLAAGGCVVQDTPEKVAQIEETRDPFEPTNRYVFEVNRFLDEVSRQKKQEH